MTFPKASSTFSSAEIPSNWLGNLILICSLDLVFVALKFFTEGFPFFSFHPFQHVLIVSPHKNRKMVERKVMMTWGGIIVMVI